MRGTVLKRTVYKRRVLTQAEQEDEAQAQKDYEAYKNDVRDPTPAEKQERARLEAIHGEENVWNMNELIHNFDVLEITKTFVFVRRRGGKEEGRLQYISLPGAYWFSFGYEKK